MNPISLIRRIAVGQHGVVTIDQCRAAGVSPDQIKNECRARRWTRLNEGVYLIDAGRQREQPTRTAALRAALLSAGPASVAVLRTAAEVHGIAGLSSRDVIDVSLPGQYAKPRRSTEPGLRLHQFALRPEHVTYVNGLAVTTVVRTLADLLLRVDRLTAVSLLDSSLHRGLLPPDELNLVATLLTGRRGAVRARPWLALADGRAESPLETRVRLRASDGGVPPDELQYRVHDRWGAVVAIADLAWLKGRVVGEADGTEAHDNPTALFRDRKRQNDIVAAGFTPVRFTWADTLGPEYIPSAIRAAASAARRR